MGRVLLITRFARKAGIGGIQRFRHDLLGGLLEAGVRVDVMGPGFTMTSADHEALQMAVSDESPRALWRTTVMTLLQRAVPRIVGHCDVVLTDHVEALPQAVLAASVAGRPLGAMCYGMEIRGRARLMRLFRVAVRRFIAISSWTATEVARVGGGVSEKIATVQPGIDTAWWGQGLPSGVERWRNAGRDLFTVLTVARLTRDRDKGHEIVMRALADERLRGARIRYWIAGGGADASRLRGIAQELQIESRVSFLGILSDEQLRATYDDVDLLAMPSRNRNGAGEGFGLTFLEAAARGVPSVGARGTGADDAIVDGVTGWLVSPTDPRELSGLLSDLVQNRSLVEARGRAAADRVHNTFSRRQSATRILSALGMVI